MTSQYYHQFDCFLSFKYDWMERYFEDRPDEKSLRGVLRARTIQLLDGYISSLNVLRNKLQEFDIYVMDKSKDIIPDERGKEYLLRQRELYIYKTLRDLFKDIYEREFPSTIDRDGDHVMQILDTSAEEPQRGL